MRRPPPGPPSGSGLLRGAQPSWALWPGCHPALWGAEPWEAGGGAHARLLSSVPFPRLPWHGPGPRQEKEFSGPLSEPLPQRVWRTPWTPTCRGRVPGTPRDPAGGGSTAPSQVVPAAGRVRVYSFLPSPGRQAPGLSRAQETRGPRSSWQRPVCVGRPGGFGVQSDLAAPRPALRATITIACKENL